MGTARVSRLRRSALGLVTFVAGIGIVASATATADAATVTKTSYTATVTGGHTSSGCVRLQDWWWP